MDFTWRDGERTIRFGRGSVAGAPELLAEPYALLTTERAQSAAPDVVAGAGSVHHVAPGFVDQLAAALLDEVPDVPLLVALGGGRVVDTAKSVAAARRGAARVAAIPTTLSAAEMTRVHRMPAGAPPDLERVRPAIVINDPALCASQPAQQLAASAANSLGHAIEGPLTTLASPVPSLAGREAARLTAAAYAGAEPDRDALALAALLSGYSIDANWYGLHHVLSQTLVRLGGAGHGPANAAMLPHTARGAGAARGRSGGRCGAGTGSRPPRRRRAPPRPGYRARRAPAVRGRRGEAARARPHPAPRGRRRAARALRGRLVGADGADRPAD